MFTFKQFEIDDSHCGMKVGTDGVLLGAWVECSTAASIIDAGCGSGIISLMMAQRNHCAKIIGVDIDMEACGDAKTNVGKSPWSDRVEISCGDVLSMNRDTLPSPLLIISNPPFFNETLRSPDADRSLARHGEGFEVNSLIELADRLISTPEDTLAFIAPASRIDEIEFQLSLHRLDVRRRALVFSREGRKAMRMMFQAGRGIKEHMSDIPVIIRDFNNNLTDQYRKLTSDFYLDR